MQTRKQQLVNRVIGYLVKHGVADLSLRPMADEIGTSARLLIFHFGSKDQLLVEVFQEMQNRLRLSLAKLHLAPAAKRDRPLLRVFWDWATAGDNLGYVSLQYELQMLAVRKPDVYGRYLRANATAWVAAIQAALPEGDRDPAFATVLGAVFDGLFLELIGSGDLERTTRALDSFIARTRKRPGKPAHLERP